MLPSAPVLRFGACLLALTLSALTLSSCIDVPDLDRAVPAWVDASPYPALTNVEGLQTGHALPAEESQALQEQLTARAARLKRRANALNQPVLDDSARSRMESGVSQ